MPAIFCAEEIFEITSGRLAQGMMPDEEGPVICDTRLPLEGAWFAALTGAQFDGHDFLGDAFAGGAIGCIVEERTNYAIGSQQFPLIAVTDPLYAIADLARNWRRRLNPRVIAVACGAFRLTALTVCLGRMLGKARKTLMVGCEDHRTEAIFSGLLNMDDDTKYVVAAVTPDDLEKVELIAQTLRPDILIVLKESFFNLKIRESQGSVEKATQIMSSNVSPSRGFAAIGAVDSNVRSILQSVLSWRSFIDEHDAAGSAIESAAPIEGELAIKKIGSANADSDSIKVRFRDCDLEEVWSLAVACQALGLTDNELSRCFDGVIDLSATNVDDLI